MQSFAFDGSYEDDRGREALRWEIVPCTRYGPRMPVVEIRTVIRGVPVWGTDFDMLSADDPDASRAASLAGDPDDSLEGCVLAGDLPVVFDVSGRRQDGVVRFTLDLRFGPGHPREDPKNLTLTAVVAGITYEAVDERFEGGLAGLERQFPADVRLVSCITCLYSGYSPQGHGLLGMRCHRDAKAQYLAARSKHDFWHVPWTEEVPETYLCPEYAPRVHQRWTT